MAPIHSVRAFASPGTAASPRLTLRPVPGTLDRVSVSTGHARWIVGLASVRQVLGREAGDALHLRGHFTLPPGERNADLLAALLGSPEAGPP